MKLDENICIAPHCEETKLLVDRGCLFCTEHITKFKDFSSRHQVSSEIDYFIENNEEFQNEFFNDMVYYFFVEEEQEYYRKNKQLLKKKKPKKKSKKKSKKWK